MFGVVLLVGCGTTRDVAVTSYHVTRDVAVGSYHVATAPVHLVHKAIAADSPPTPSPTTTTTTSDVTTPGRPVPATSSRSSQQQRIASSSTETRSGNAPAKSKGSTLRSASAQPQFPTAKPVPGRPGLVFNPYDPNGGYIDVKGYAPGSKVKDPDSQKIFIVP
jgi:hypothetical protein